MNKHSMELLPENMAMMVDIMAQNGVNDRLLRLFAKTSGEITVHENNQDQLLAVYETVNTVKGIADVNKRLMFGYMKQQNAPLVKTIDIMNGRSVEKTPPMLLPTRSI